MVLFRPVGQSELQKIALLEFEGFPPRFETQPIFYPVLNEDYAIQIAREWNTKDATSGFAGYVTRFEIDDEYASTFEKKIVGSQIHEELWVPAEELEEFNKHILAPIDVIHAFRSIAFVRRQFDLKDGTEEEWKELVNLWTSAPWHYFREVQCHEHCDFCMASLCTDHFRPTGDDFSDAYLKAVSDETDFNFEYFLCPPCFEAIRDEFDLKLV